MPPAKKKMKPPKPAVAAQHPLDVSGVLQAAKDGDWPEFTALLASQSQLTADDFNSLPPGRSFGVVHQICYHACVEALQELVATHPQVDLTMLTKDGLTVMQVAKEAGANVQFLATLREMLAAPTALRVVPGPVVALAAIDPPPAAAAAATAAAADDSRPSPCRLSPDQRGELIVSVRSAGDESLTKVLPFQVTGLLELSLAECIGASGVVARLAADTEFLASLRSLTALDLSVNMREMPARDDEAGWRLGIFAILEAMPASLSILTLPEGLGDFVWDEWGEPDGLGAVFSRMRGTVRTVRVASQRLHALLWSAVIPLNSTLQWLT